MRKLSLEIVRQTLVSLVQELDGSRLLYAEASLLQQHCFALTTQQPLILQDGMLSFALLASLLKGGCCLTCLQVTLTS